MNKIQALVDFWGQFGLKAYDETSVPDKAPLPYLTFEVSSGEMGDDISQTCNLWYRSTSWSEISNKAEEIYSYIGRGGRIVLYDGGAIWIKRTNYSRMRESDDMIRRIILNYTVEYID